MLARFILWLQRYLFKRKATELLRQVEVIKNGSDYSLYFKEYFTYQSALLHSPFFQRLMLRQLGNGVTYVYGDLNQMRVVYRRALESLQQQMQVEFGLHKEVRQNAVLAPLKLIYRDDVSIYEQLVELDKLLHAIRDKFLQLPRDWQLANIGRITTFYELYAFLVSSTIRSYLEVSHE